MTQPAIWPDFTDQQKTILMKRLFAKARHNPSTGCIEWLGCTTRGYGSIELTAQYLGETRNVRVHRLSYVLHKGRVPEGLLVCHSCDNPGCINPDHLWVGTTKDKAMDCAKKLRNRSYLTPSGVRSHRAKLTNEQVDELRSSSLSTKEAIAAYGISRSQIKKIRAYKHYPVLSVADALNFTSEPEGGK